MTDFRHAIRVLPAILLLACMLSAATFAAAAEPAAPATSAAAPAPAAAAPAGDGQSRLDKAINAAVTDGKINLAAAPGFLNIPGAIEVNPIIAFAWALWVGWIFSTVGAFGGVMAGVGHMSVFGLGDYASSFGKGAPLNKLVTDSIRVSNQWLVGLSSLVSSIKYASMGRIVLPLGIALGVGSLVGSWLVPTLTQGKISFKEYQGYFGVFVLVLGCYLLYETTPWGQAKKKKSAAAAKAFEEASKHKTGGSATSTRVQIVSVSLSRVVFTFCGVEFAFNTFLPVIGGFLIAAAASVLGVGGGFLLVPFLTSISQLPMYLAAGTSAFAVLVGMVTSITTFMSGGVPVHWPLVGLELCGVLVGSWIGPITAKYLPDAWLKRIFIVLAFIVGVDFVLKGFFGIKLL
jgi:uncharacterized membrane protein YfcA